MANGKTPQQDCQEAEFHPQTHYREREKSVR